MSLIDETRADNVAPDGATDNTQKVIAETSVTSKTAGTSDQTRKRSRGTSQQSSNFVSKKLLSVGFVFALLLALLCLTLSIFYLFQYLVSANTGITQLLDKVAAQQIKLETGQLEVLINGRLVMGRLGLLSCGVLAGVSFGFLGFALFLLGIRESMDVSVESVSYRANAARMSPGVFLIVVAAILIGVCATRETPFNYSIDETKSTAPGAGSTPAAGTSPTPNVESPGLAPKIVPDQP